MKTVKIEVITPQFAAAVLENKNHSNRHIRRQVVATLTEAIRNGEFRTTHQGISFYEDGTLADGQHRLSAIVAANMPVTMSVMRGLSKDDGLVIDCGEKRKLHDQIRLSSVSEFADKSHVSVSTFFLQVLPNTFKRPTIDDTVRFFEIHGTLIDQAAKIAAAKKKKLHNAGIIATYATALQAEEVQKMFRFHTVLTSGIVESPSENAAVRLRIYLTNADSRVWASENAKDTLRRCQRAVYAFCRGEDLGAIKAQPDYKYPVLTLTGGAK